MLGNESNGSSRRSAGRDSGPPAELLSASAPPRPKKRRLGEDPATQEPLDQGALDQAIKSANAIFNDLKRIAKDPGGLVPSPGAKDLLEQLKADVAQIAILWRHTHECESRLDEIDAVASGVWNLAVNVKTEEGPPRQTDARFVLAQLRSSAYTLIEISENMNSDSNALLKLLTLGALVGKAFFSNADFKSAQDAYQRAGQIYDKLLARTNSSKGSESSLANVHQPFMQLCLWRAELAFELGNNNNAHHLIGRALDREVTSFAKPTFLEAVIRSEIEFARRLIEQNEHLDAAKWARKALALMDTDEESNSAQNRKLSRQTTAGLRTTCLKLLATAYIYSKVPSNLELAGNAIELAQQLKSNDAGLFHLDLQKRLLEETAEEKNLIELCSKAIQASDLGDEATISVLASMIHSCSERCAKQHVLRCYQNLLSRLRGTNHVVWIERLLCAIGNVLTGPGDDDVPANESCHAFRQIYESLANTGLVISATTASSCQLMFWRSGDDSFAAGKIADALAFFTTSMEMRLDSFDMHNQQILNRRIADCHLKLGNPEAARKTITDSLDPALSKHPATLRLLFEADFLQNRVSDCVSDIEAIAAAPDSAAAASALGQVASFAADHSAGSDLVSIAIKNLIPIVKQDPLLARGRLLSLYRKLLDINKANMTEEAAARSNFPIFQEVLDLCQAPSATGDSDDQQHETEWLARNCWNAAVALESGNDMSMVARYLQIACALCNVASQGCKEEDRGDYLKRSVVGHTMTAAARLREAKAAVGADRKAEALEFALEEVERCKESLGTDSGTGELPGRELLLIEFECLLGLKRFNDLEKFLRNLPEDVHWSTLELMVDAAVKSDECPSGLQFLVIQSTLDAVLRQDEIDVSRLATWMRVLIITACNRNQSAALQFFSQVLEVLEDVEYPETEIEWLLIKAWNIGCDAMVAGDRRKAKTWSEIAMKCLPHLTSTKSKYESTMNETYAKIVAMEGEAQL